MSLSRVLRISQSSGIVARPSTRSSRRFLHSSPPVGAAPGKDPQLSQGGVSQKGHRHPGDAHDQAARSGQSTADKSPYDAASPHPDKQASRQGLSGNPEGVGFAEQVGSASSSADHGLGPSEGKGGHEESTPPGFLDAVKSKLGFKTTSGEVKQNRGGGEGVTGTGTFPGTKRSEGRMQMHTSAITRMVDPTKGQPPDSSRKPKDSTHAEQSDHLKHRSETDSDISKGKGNAAAQPSLPSHKVHKFGKDTSVPQQRRGFHTSPLRLKQEHTAESYFKDVDNSPPKSSKTHQVDPSGTGAKVTRPHELVPGERSDAGSETKEYQTVSKDKPYDTPPTQGKESEKKLRYGGPLSKSCNRGMEAGSASGLPLPPPDTTADTGRTIEMQDMRHLPVSIHAARRLNAYKPSRTLVDPESAPLVIQISYCVTDEYLENVLEWLCRLLPFEKIQTLELVAKSDMNPFWRARGAWKKRLKNVTVVRTTMHIIEGNRILGELWADPQPGSRSRDQVPDDELFFIPRLEALQVVGSEDKSKESDYMEEILRRRRQVLDERKKMST
ncbi:predicted protein [Postia placenta Mad-698-R]|nr:predicted protein [Postia placenta Mad-698-R]